MSLPFLKDKHRDIATIMMDNRTGKRTETSGDIESKDSPNHDADLESACTDLLNALERKDITGIRDAFKACFQCCESQPHEESSEPEDESA